MHNQIPNNFQEDVNSISPQKALAMGKSNMDYKAPESSAKKVQPKNSSSPRKGSKGRGAY